MVLKKTIDRILPETAERLPDKTALIFADRTFTYRQLEYLTNRTANGLKALGVKKGHRVTLFAQNSAEWVQSYIGIAKAGAVINPVNAMLTADELAYVVKDCGAKVLITTSERAKAVSDLRKDGSLDHVIVLSGVPPEGAISFTDLLAEQAELGRGRRQRARRAVHDLLHLRHHRVSQRRDAQSRECGVECRDDGGDECAHRA